MRTIVASALLLYLAAATAFAVDMTKVNIVIRNQAGKPVDHASVEVRFVSGHSVVKLGKSVHTTYSLRTNQEGEANIPEIPQGKIRIQVIAKGFQTYGELYEINEPEKNLNITLNPPQQQYSAH
jgi:hypothetical protein